MQRKVIGPLFEDVILMNVLQLIDPRLPKFVRKYYQLKMGDRRLMDIKTDIFNNIKEFLSEMETAAQLAALCLQSSGAATAVTASASLAALSTARAVRPRGRGRGIPQPQPTKRTFCKSCYQNERGKLMYLSHHIEAYNCPTKIKLNTMVEELLPPEVREQETDQELTEDSAENS